MSPKTHAFLRALMGAPSTARQVAALCTRADGHVLLLTSRDTGRWVLPKGWPMRKRTPHAAAAQEAWEEAGIRGAIAPTPIGHFTATKTFPHALSLPVRIDVFPMRVHTIAHAYPEAGQRQRAWFTPQHAARLVHEPELAALLHTPIPYPSDPFPPPSPPLHGG